MAKAPTKKPSKAVAVTESDSVRKGKAVSKGASKAAVQATLVKKKASLGSAVEAYLTGAPRKKVVKLVAHIEEDFQHSREDLEDALESLKHAEADCRHAMEDFNCAIRDFQHAVEDWLADDATGHSEADQTHSAKDYSHAEDDLAHALQDFRRALKDFKHAMRDLRCIDGDLETLVKLAAGDGVEITVAEAKAYFAAKFRSDLA